MQNDPSVPVARVTSLVVDLDEKATFLAIANDNWIHSVLLVRSLRLHLLLLLWFWLHHSDLAS